MVTDHFDMNLDLHLYKFMIIQDQEANSVELIIGILYTSHESCYV
jgi:hypothetical protein